MYFVTERIIYRCCKSTSFDSYVFRCEAYDYIFEVAVKMLSNGLDPTKKPGQWHCFLVFTGTLESIAFHRSLRSVAEEQLRCVVKCFEWPRFKDWVSSQSHLSITWNVSILIELSLVHTSDISIRTRSIRKQSIISPQELAKIKQLEFFFVSSFVRLLAYARTVILCLWLRRSSCRRLDFIPLFCLLFCPCAYAYAYVHVWTRL